MNCDDKIFVIDQIETYKSMKNDDRNGEPHFVWFFFVKHFKIFS